METIRSPARGPEQPAQAPDSASGWFLLYILIFSSNAGLTALHFFLLLDAHVKTATPAKPSVRVGFFILFLPHLNFERSIISVSDPDPDWIQIQSCQWIRIQNPYPAPGGHK
jgi:hypothetical protein